VKNLRFIYAGDKYDPKREKVITNIINIIRSELELPDIIEVEFSKLQESVYGEATVDTRFKNRIKLNETLSPKGCIVPTIHELIHLNQIYTGRLSGRRDGSYLWENKVYPSVSEISYEQYRKLPWEIDVVERQQKLLHTVLSVGLSKI
jgi:hypothetical protein